MTTQVQLRSIHVFKKDKFITQKIIEKPKAKEITKVKFSKTVELNVKKKKQKSNQ